MTGRGSASLFSRITAIKIITVAATILPAVINNAAAESIRIVSPPDSVWVSEPEIFLAGTVDGAAQTIEIDGAGKTEIKAGGVFGAVVELDRGLNRIKLETKEADAELKVFWVKDGDKDTPPGDFGRFYSHIEPEARECSQCHRFRDGKFDFSRLIPARSNCYECHDDIGRSEHVHGPVGAGVCISCHNIHGSFNSRFLTKEGGELCTSCHQNRRDEFEQEHVHPPLEDGCTDCHSPHESANRYQLKYEGESLSSLCMECHDPDLFMKSTQHSPVEEGDCVACHRPHSSANPFLLIASAEGGALCFECHDYMREDFEMEYVHAPVEESCTECHDPHSAEAGYLLKREGGEVCAMCHEEYTPEIYEAIRNAKTEHPPVAEQLCVECHRPHSSNYASLLKDSMENLCFTCHTDLGATVRESENRHGPVKTGDCTECHNVHGSQFSRLLARYYPEEFYTGYAKNKYDLCFGCHNRDIARTKRTETLTNFRDGSYNLHYFHVNNDKGRTCTACHAPHASNQPKHIRYEVPFGAWSYPVNLTKTETGGTCVVGCHAPKTYDRINPVLTR